MEFQLLGPVEARINGELVDIGHARQRCVLATLLLEANQVVSADQLVERAWGEHRPRGVRGTLHTYVSRIRKVLAGGVTVTLRSGGYRLTVDESAVDAHRFHRLVTDARAADDERAIALFEAALGLWRGEALADLDTPWLAGVRSMLHQERFAAALDHNDAALRHGQHARLIPALSMLAGGHPLDERLAGQLMLALYRGGRQADALDHYEQTRRRLVEELGADPSPVLRQLHQRILTADPALVEFADVRRHPLPRQLPAGPPLFVGRDAELDKLASMAGTGAAVVISAIGGVGGVGKTWLALYWAHRQLGRFPDGQLFVNLRGFDPVGEPMAPIVVVRGFLDALGVDQAAVPADLEAQVGLYRSLMADRRMLVVLDNAADTTQVGPLLPGSPGCTVLITSRHRLTGLVATHGARPLALDVLGDDDARALLTRRIGEHRVAAEPEALAELLRCCAGLPLALGIVAARAVTEPALPLAALAAELRDHASRLDALDTGEPALSLRAVFSASYHALSGEAATLFGLLGLAPGPDIGLPAIASLAALPTEPVRTLLWQLESAHLVQQHLPGRYRMHDLVRLYAADQAPRDHTQEQRRLVDHYLHTAHAAGQLVYPRRQPFRLGAPAPGCVPQLVDDEGEALSWFDAEHPVLLAVHRLAAQLGWHLSVWQLAWSLNTFHRRCGRIHDDVEIGQAMLSAAEQLDAPARSWAHRFLAHAYGRFGSTKGLEITTHLRAAVIIADETESDSTISAAQAREVSTRLPAHENDIQRALADLRKQRRRYQELQDPLWEADMLMWTGWLSAGIGLRADAHSDNLSALRLFREHHDLVGQAAVLDTLGFLAHQSGQHTDALTYYRQALEFFRSVNDTYNEADTLSYLGHVHLALHQPDEANQAWRRALDLYRSQQRQADADRIQSQLEGT